jgi:hypothetical protein
LRSIGELPGVTGRRKPTVSDCRLDGSPAGDRAWLGSDNRYHPLYELQLTNTLGTPADLRSVEVLDAENGKTLLTLEAAEIINGDYLHSSTASSPRAHRSRRLRGAS